MPRVCLCCASDAAGELAKAIAAGGSNRQLAVRFGLTESSVQRHRVGCLRSPRRTKETGGNREPGNVGAARRFESDSDGRCSTCGLLAEGADPPSLLRRAERLLRIAENVATTAQSENDSRLCLMATDRARGALELVMKAVGMIGGDGGITLNVDQRRLGLTTIASLPADFVRRLAAGDSAALDQVLDATVAPDG